MTRTTDYKSKMRLVAHVRQKQQRAIRIPVYTYNPPLCHMPLYFISLHFLLLYVVYKPKIYPLVFLIPRSIVSIMLGSATKNLLSILLTIYASEKLKFSGLVLRNFSFKHAFPYGFGI